MLTISFWMKQIQERYLLISNLLKRVGNAIQQQSIIKRINHYLKKVRIKQLQSGLVAVNGQIMHYLLEQRCTEL